MQEDSKNSMGSAGLDEDRLPVSSDGAKGGGIPRLQELSFLEVAAIGIADRATFEGIRQRLIDHMINLRQSVSTTGNVATFRIAKDQPIRYVRNVSDALKELMRIGLVRRTNLPSSATAARIYRDVTFALTDSGLTWVTQVKTDPRAGYDALLQMLWKAHPQFGGYVRSISRGLVIPIAQWGEISQLRTRERYIDFLVARVSNAVESGNTGWSASEALIREAIVRYTETILEGARSRQRPDPFSRNQDFVHTCEEALVKLAFNRCGLEIDYISHEILRRWTRELGIASFSYHVPGLPALRLWPTASALPEGREIRVSRYGSAELRRQAIEFLGEAYERVRRTDPQKSMWVPIYRVRADVCYHLRISDAVFDRAVTDFLRGERHAGVRFRINFDPAQYGSLPPTESPLRIKDVRGIRTYYCMSLVPCHDEPPTKRS
jgi:hypothetical protein